MKKSFLLVLPLVALAAPAQAQDAASGFRIELLALYDDIEADLGEDTDQFNPARDRDVDGAFGIGVGYDFLNGPGARAGVDLEVTHSTSRQNVIDNNSSIGGAKFGLDLYAGGRVTVPVTGRFNLVGKLGVTSFDVDYDITSVALQDDFDSGRLMGVRGGVGVQYSGEDDRTYYGVEYRYSNYEQGVVRQQVGLVVGARF